MNSWIGHTNQKLYFARLLLEQAEADSSVQAQAAGEGALALLGEAWLSYLNELAINASAGSRVTSLAELMAVVPLVTGEITEIKNLSVIPGSWVVEMSAALAGQNQPKAAKAVQDVPSGLIALRAADGLPLRQWWQAMSDLIDSQRENRQET
ncbi:MAG TPA: hypothetical protein DEA26_07795 [Oceanospirillales bacterium]|nr:hypothetical protein [Oceanospirillaceae bacterium]HBS42567.1 hypothetical protein [Oceanospirillales bacterium]|tara:strand:+ start:55223 stop:55678 length:456 start_codon:yes stop_codon:yes gene_type:complete